MHTRPRHRSPRTAFVSTCVALLMTCTVAAATAGTDPKPVDALKPKIHGAQELRATMIGRWHGTAPTKDNGRREWLLERFADGTFEVHFVTVQPGGRIERSAERGLWGIAGTVYFTITRSRWRDGRFVEFDPDNASLYDAYDVLELDATHLRYRGVETGNEFVVKRVSAEFTLPDDPM